MEQVSLTLTVYFDGQFYVGLFEQTEKGRLRVCRFVFGPEPKERELLDFLSSGWRRLAFSPAVAAECLSPRPKSPKRMQREAAHALTVPPSSTKSQQAQSLAHEQRALVRKENKRARKEAEKDEAFALRQQKRKEKHRGH